MANNGHYGDKPGASRQGIYVCAPSGKFLASVNSNNPERVLATLKRGLEVWEELPASERPLADDAKIRPRHRWEDSYPADGLVLTMYTRDLPEDANPDQDRAPKWNQDPVWFSKSEARQWLPAELTVGAEHTLPRPLALRLACLHLTDTVKGQTSTFSEEEIKELQIGVKVVALSNEFATLEIAGNSSADSARKSRRTSPHGVKTTMMGNAKFDLKKERFAQFELVAVGKRWGYTRFNGRHRDATESPVGFVFQLATEQTPRIAPAFIDRYSADWVKQPK